jgi:tetratricopeptide (TPR) repeat protein
MVSGIRYALLFSALLLAACASGLLHSAVDYYVSGEYEKAIQTADWALETRNPTAEERALANLIKAQSLEKLGDRDSAIGFYQYVVDTYPETSHSYQAGQQLRRLQRAGALAP